MPRHVDLADLGDHERLCFLALAMHDAKASQRAATTAALQELPKLHDAYFAFLEVAVVRYARPFLDCYLPSTGTKTRLPESYLASLGYPDAQKLLAFHGEIIDLRKKLVAHTDLQGRELGLSARLGSDGRSSKIVVAVTMPPLSRENLEALSELADRLQNALYREVDSLARSIRPEIFAGTETAWLLGGAPGPDDVLFE